MGIFFILSQPPLPVAATPAIDPAGGTFAGAVTVALATETAGAGIRFTLDGTDPTPSSQVYSASFVLESSATVKAVAYLDGYSPSAVARADFLISGQPGGVVNFSDDFSADSRSQYTLENHGRREESGSFCMTGLD